MNCKTQCALVLVALLTLVAWSATHSFAEQAKKDATEPDEEWEVLFDGTSTDAFRSWKSDKLKDKGWVIEADGSLHAKDGSHDIVTRKQYGDFDLRWEWKLSKGANSGLLYRAVQQGNHPHSTGAEYQIIDDKRVHRTSTASLYALMKPSSQAKANPAGEWNASRIVIKDNQVEHYLNGVLAIQYEWGSDDIKARISDSKFKKWKNYMQAEAGYIGFQSHGSDLWFRNIKIKDLSEE